MRFMTLVLALLLASGCHGKPHVERRASGTATITRQPVGASEVVAPGIVEPWGDEVRLAPEEQGQVLEVAVAEGDVVEAGQTIARLDDAVQKHALELAEAERAEAEAQLRKLRLGSTPEEIELARAERDGAEELAAQRRRDADRLSKLSSTGTLPEADAERTRSEAQALAWSARASGARARLVVRGPRAEDRAMGEARLLAAEARVRGAQASLKRRRLQAPARLKILWSRWHVGELYVPGSRPLAIAGDVSKLQIRTEVDELDADRVHPGMPCELFADDGARVGRGRIVRVAPSYGRRGLTLESPTSRTDVRVREVFVEVAEPGSLAPGQRLWVHVAGAPAS